MLPESEHDEIRERDAYDADGELQQVMTARSLQQRLECLLGFVWLHILIRLSLPFFLARHVPYQQHCALPQ